MDTMIELPALRRSAELAPNSVDNDARTVEVIWSAGARVRRASFFGESYDEELSLDPAHVRLERLNAGAPFLKVHEIDTLDAVIGSVVPGSARIENGRGIALVRISERADVEPIWRDIQAGHIRAVSIGYQVHRFEVSKPDSGRELWRAVDWTPFEVSAVPVGADPAAGFRAKGEQHDCVLHRRDAETSEGAPPMTDKTPAAPADQTNETAATEETTMTDEKTGAAEAQAHATDTHSQPGPESQRSASAKPEAPDTEAIATRAREAERDRVSTIYDLAGRLNLERSFAEDLVKGGAGVFGWSFRCSRVRASAKIQKKAPMDIRNIAIIAHVDHGKTTMVDQLLKQSGSFRENQAVADRVMDSGDIERERGITILAKATSVEWKGTRINIVDTPGHADFGGEVERILSMVDGVCLLVDAAEGPMPQTKFVTSKALALGLRPIVVVNKVDKPAAEPDQALNEVFDLFANLGASDEQLDFPHLYASGIGGWADEALDGPRKDLSAMFDMILKHVPAPAQMARREEPFQMLAVTLGADNFLGRLLTGRIEAGSVKPGDNVKALSREGARVEQFRVSKVLAFRGVTQQPIDQADAGDIVTLAGMSRATVADTICAPEVDTALPAQPIDPPTISVTFGINDSPLAGQDGKKVQSRVIRERLMKEAESNVAIRVEDTPGGEAFVVSGRGELQMGVLIENMRREGFELSISRPRVIFREEDGQRLEPVEEVIIDVDDDFTGVVIEKLTGERKGEMVDMRPAGSGKTRIVAHVPSRGLIGYHGEFMTDTRGNGVLNRIFHGWAPYKGAIQGRRQGVLISMENGISVAYALWNLEDRGKMFVGAQEQLYQGMIIGEHSRDNDLEVNPLKGKKLTNVRASGTDEAVRLTPPIRMSLEEAIAYINDDELVEVTPKNIRLRKRWLDPHERKRQSRSES